MRQTLRSPQREQETGLVDILRGLSERTQIPWLLRHHAHRVVLAIYGFLSGGISIALLAALAVISGSPFIFPSLGPTAFLFFYTPLVPSASPRNTFCGHAIAIVAGYASLVVTGLTTSGATINVGTTWPRVLAAALSLGFTAGGMIFFRVPHPPAASTALIASLGLLTQPWQLVVLLGGVVLLILQALIINRLAGIPYSLWQASPTASGQAKPTT